VLSYYLDPRRWDSDTRRVASEAAAASLREAAPRVRERTLGAGSLDYLMLEHHEAVRAAEGPCVIRSRADGGAVANSYGDGATADWCSIVTVVGEVDGDLVAEGTSVVCARAWARKVPHGDNGRTVTRALRAGLPSAQTLCDVAGLNYPSMVAYPTRANRRRSNAGAAVAK
jgi:hypothetical protein